jgi:PadR family transcriptional regulator PadR
MLLSASPGLDNSRAVLRAPTSPSDMLPLDARWESEYPRRSMGRSRAAPSQNDLLQGTLDMLILRVLRSGEMHGWGIADRIQLVSKEVLSVGEGSLYPALYRLEAQGWIDSTWGQSDNNRRAKFYRLTKSGRRQLDVEQAAWDRVALAIAEVMRSA